MVRLGLYIAAAIAFTAGIAIDLLGEPRWEWVFLAAVGLGVSLRALIGELRERRRRSRPGPPVEREHIGW